MGLTVWFELTNSCCLSFILHLYDSVVPALLLLQRPFNLLAYFSYFSYFSKILQCSFLLENTRCPSHTRYVVIRVHLVITKLVIWPCTTINIRGKMTDKYRKFCRYHRLLTVGLSINLTRSCCIVNSNTTLIDL